MSHIIADRVKETSTTTGMGTFTLSGASTGAVTFNSVMADGDTCDYCIEGLNADGTLNGQWEVGVGTYNDTDILARTTVTASSNSGSHVNFSAGTKNVFLTLSATRLQAAADISAVSGTWTPVVEGATTAGTGTYTFQNGSYYKVGNICFFNCLVTITAHTGTGNFRITGLPFTASNTPAVSVPCAVRAENLTFSNQLFANVVANTTRLDLMTMSSGASWANVTLDTACTVGVSGVYLVA